MYTIIIGFEDYAQHCDVSDLQLCWQYAREKPHTTSQEFRNLADVIIEEENLPVPRTPKDGLSLYFDLIHHIQCN
jgi:hypothetical protein